MRDTPYRAPLVFIPRSESVDAVVKQLRESGYPLAEALHKVQVWVILS